MATLRAWMGLDRDFAKAVRIAHRRELGQVHLWMFNDLEDGDDPRAIPPPTTAAWGGTRAQRLAESCDEHPEACASLRLRVTGGA